MRDSRASCAGIAVVVVIAAATSAGTAQAQVAASLSVQSEERFRGRPVSAGQPIMRLDLTIDRPGGLYIGASATAVARDGVQLLGAQQYAGYAHRTRSGTVVEAGIVNRYYGPVFSGGFEADFVEGYAGVARAGWSARLYASPSYYGTGRSTLYVELDKGITLDRHWTIDAHAGMLVPLNDVPNPRFVRAQYDARVGVTRALGRMDMQLGFAWAGPRPDAYGGVVRGHGALVVGATYGF